MLVNPRIGPAPTFLISEKHLEATDEVHFGLDMLLLSLPLAINGIHGSRSYHLGLSCQQWSRL